MTSTSLIPQEAAAAGFSFEELCRKIIENIYEKNIDRNLLWMELR
jgi:hypothetical protein